MYNLFAFYLCRSFRVRREFCTGFYWKRLVPNPRRHLFTASSLGIDEFEAFRKTVTARLLSGPENYLDEVWNKLTKNEGVFILTDDVKRAIASTSTDDDIERLIRICQRYQQQSKDIKLFSFGPGLPLMQLLYQKKKPELMYNLILDEQNAEMFDQLSCYHICMDALFKSIQYGKVLEVYEAYRGRSIGQKQPFPRFAQILVTAACYKINTADSFDVGLRFAQEVRKAEQILVRKAVAFLSASALNQNRSELALEFLSLLDGENHIAIRSLKLHICSKLQRYLDILETLNGLLERDLPSYRHIEREITEDSIQAATKAFKSCPIRKFRERFDEMERLLRSGSHITRFSIDDILCAPIASVPLRLEPLQLSRDMETLGASEEKEKENQHFLNDGRFYLENFDSEKGKNPISTLPRVNSKNSFRNRVLRSVADQIRTHGPMETGTDDPVQDQIHQIQDRASSKSR